MSHRLSRDRRNRPFRVGAAAVAGVTLILTAWTARLEQIALDLQQTQLSRGEPEIQVSASVGPASTGLGLDLVVLNAGGSPVTISSVTVESLRYTFVTSSMVGLNVGSFDYVELLEASLPDEQPGMKACELSPAVLEPGGEPAVFAAVTRTMTWPDGRRLISAPPPTSAQAVVTIEYFGRPPETVSVDVTGTTPPSLWAQFAERYQQCWQTEWLDDAALVVPVDWPFELETFPIAVPPDG